MNQTIKRNMALTYLGTWLPAFLLTVLLALFPRISQTVPSFVLFFFQWVFALLFLIGWSVLWGRFAYLAPRQAFGGILLFLGVSLLLTVNLYNGILPRLSPLWGPLLAGIFSFTPLDCILQLLLPFSLPHELVILVGMTLLFLLAWAIGIGLRKELKGYDRI